MFVRRCARIFLVFNNISLKISKYTYREIQRPNHTISCLSEKHKSFGLSEKHKSVGLSEKSASVKSTKVKRGERLGHAKSAE